MSKPSNRFGCRIGQTNGSAKQKRSILIALEPAITPVEGELDFNARRGELCRCDRSNGTAWGAPGGRGRRCWGRTTASCRLRACVMGVAAAHGSRDNVLLAGFAALVAQARCRWPRAQYVSVLLAEGHRGRRPRGRTRGASKRTTKASTRSWRRSTLGRGRRARARQ